MTIVGYIFVAVAGWFVVTTLGLFAFLMVKGAAKSEADYATRCHPLDPPFWLECEDCGYQTGRYYDCDKALADLEAHTLADLERSAGWKR